MWDDNNNNNGLEDVIEKAIKDVSSAVGPTSDNDFVADQLKHLWSPQEDIILSALVAHFGAKNWNLMARGIPGRSGMSCRLRWCNHLDPALQCKPFTPEEDAHIIQNHSLYGNNWASMAKFLRGRTDNTIKNHWHSSVSRRLVEDGKDNPNPNPANPSEDLSNASSKENQLSEDEKSEHAEFQINNKSPVENRFSAQPWVPCNLFRPMARVSTYSFCNIDPIDAELASLRGSTQDSGTSKFLKGACGERVIPSNCGHGCCETHTNRGSQRSLLGPIFVDYEEPPSITSHELAAVAMEINNIAWQKSGLDKSSVMIASSGLDL